MNTDTLVQMMQKGFHITVGAASFLVETATAQDQQKRDENLSKLQTGVQSGDFNTLSEEWAIAGEQKEKEARTFVESMVPPGTIPGMSKETTGTSASANKVYGPNVPVDIQNDLDVLMAELSAIREALKSEPKP